MSELHTVYRNVRQCFRTQMGKICASLFVMIVCLSAVSSVILSPLVFGSGSGAMLVLPVLIAEICLSGIFLYGLFFLFSRLYRGERAILGNVFAGFRVWPQAAGATLMMYVTMFAWLCVFSVPVSLAIMRWPSLFVIQTENGEPALNMDLALLVSAGLVAASYVCMSLRYAFVYLYMQAHAEVSVFASLRKAAELLRGFRLKLLLFCLRCCGMWFALAAVCAAAAAFLSDASGAANTVLRYAASSCMSVSAYLGAANIVLAVTGFYDWRTGTLSSEPPAAEQPAPLLPPAPETPAPEERGAQERADG